MKQFNIFGGIDEVEYIKETDNFKTMKHSIETLDKKQIEKLDKKQIEKLLVNNTIEQIADYYGFSTSGMSEHITQIFKKTKVNRLVEETGSWMNYEGRKEFRKIQKPDAWLELKETNLYKQLIIKR